MVYVDAEKLYAEVAHECQSIIHEALSLLLPGSMLLPREAEGIHNQYDFLAFNTTSFARTELVEVPLINTLKMDPNPMSVLQISTDGKTGYAVFDVEQLGIGYPSSTSSGCRPACGMCAVIFVKRACFL
jgi:alpha-mannosidase